MDSGNTGVVVLDPLIQLGLRSGQRREHPVGAELGADRPMEPLDLARRRRRYGGWVSRCSMPFSRQIRSNNASTGGRLNRPVNTLPLSVRICSGHPVGPQRLAQARHRHRASSPGPSAAH